MRYTSYVIIDPTKKLMWLNNAVAPDDIYQKDMRVTITSQKQLKKMIKYVNQDWQAMGFSNWRLPTVEELEALSYPLHQNNYLMNMRGIYAVGNGDFLNGQYVNYREGSHGFNPLLEKKVRLVRNMLE